MRSPAEHVPPDTSLSDAYALMRERGIRHLPIVNEGRLVGVVTDRDLRLATSSLQSTPFQATASVMQVMSSPVVTAAALDPVEEGARLMRRQKIGCLPVLDDDRLVGIVTGTDLLDALMRLTGLEKSSSRIEVRTTHRPEELAQLASAIAEQGLSVHSMLSYRHDDDFLHVIFRVNTIDPHQLVDALRNRGMEVVWPDREAWSR